MRRSATPRCCSCRTTVGLIKRDPVQYLGPRGIAYKAAPPICGPCAERALRGAEESRRRYDEYNRRLLEGVERAQERAESEGRPFAACWKEEAEKVEAWKDAEDEKHSKLMLEGK